MDRYEVTHRFIRIRFMPTEIDKARLDQKFQREEHVQFRRGSAYPAARLRTQSIRSTG